MTAAFGVAAPVGAVAWRTYEYALHLGHGTVKLIHSSLMALAVALGTAGVRDMWLVHADGAAALAALSVAVA